MHDERRSSSNRHRNRKKPLHALVLSWEDDSESPGRRMLVAKIKLFAGSGATGNVVVSRPEKYEGRV